MDRSIWHTYVTLPSPQDIPLLASPSLHRPPGDGRAAQRGGGVKLSRCSLVRLKAAEKRVTAGSLEGFHGIQEECWDMLSEFITRLDRTG